MCRNIVRLREGVELHDATAMEAAARQYVRKVSGFAKPSRVNAEAFEAAVATVTEATRRLMEALELRPT
ncbi:MAG: hypothetical protein A2Z12_09255 [Actinobacteria bacterium RBG_16_68_21]|nr:MAG: hypothetical protein A2Z12_09255 [Actinobacteria bacterium RBG_16_68_21]